MKPPDPVFFVERSLGKRVIADALRAAGLQVEVHDESLQGPKFRHDSPDTEWLPEVGRKEWVLLSKDKVIRTRGAERRALLDAGVAAFFLTSGNLQGPEMADAFVRAIPKMLGLLASTPRPFIARVTRTGDVELVTWSARGFGSAPAHRIGCASWAARVESPPGTNRSM